MRQCVRSIRPAAAIVLVMLAMATGVSPRPVAAESYRALGFGYDHDRFEYIWFHADVPAVHASSVQDWRGWEAQYVLEGDSTDIRRALSIRAQSLAVAEKGADKILAVLTKNRKAACKNTQVNVWTANHEVAFAEMISPRCDGDQPNHLLVRVLYGNLSAFIITYHDRGASIRTEEVEHWRRILSDVAIRIGPAQASTPGGGHSPRAGGAFNLAGFGSEGSGKKPFEVLHVGMEDQFQFMSDSQSDKLYMQLLILDWDSTGWKRAVELINWPRPAGLGSPREFFNKLVELRQTLCDSNEVHVVSEDDSSISWEIASSRCKPGTAPAGHALQRLWYGREECFQLLYTDLGSPDVEAGLDLWRRYIAAARVDVQTPRK